MAYTVRLSRSAIRDLEELREYLTWHDSPERAEYVLNRIGQALTRLGENPERGVQPRELVDQGHRGYREIHFKPYRIIYEIIDRYVDIALVTDGRRDMVALFNRRLLGR